MDGSIIGRIPDVHRNRKSMHHHHDCICIFVFIFIVGKPTAELYEISCLDLSPEGIILIDGFKVGKVIRLFFGAQAERNTEWLCCKLWKFFSRVWFFDKGTHNTERRASKPG